MTVEVYTPAPAFIVSGAGPYSIPHPYLVGTIQCVVTAEGSDIALTAGQFSVTPAEASVSGDLYLTPEAAALHAGRELRIRRSTPAEQGWVGVQGERERGLEAQLDALTLTVQELAAKVAAPLSIWTDGARLASRAAFVAANAVLPGLGRQAGEIVYAGGLAYVRTPGSTLLVVPLDPALSLPGWEPAAWWDAGHFGAVYDAQKSGGRWIGSDAVPALQAAVNAASDREERVLIRRRLRIGHRPGKDIGAMTPADHVYLFGMGSGMICHDYDPAEVIDSDPVTPGVQGNTFKGYSVFKSSDWGAITDDAQVVWKKLFKLENLAYRGLWDEHPRARAQQFCELTGYRRIELLDVDAREVSGQFFKCDYVDSAVLRGGQYIRLASGSALRLRDAGNILIDGAYFAYSADDMIDCHASDPTPNSPLLPRRTGLIVTRCTFVGCRTVVCLAAADTLISHNRLLRPYGGISFIGNTVEGQAAIRNISVTDNHIEDAIKRPLERAGASDNNPLLPVEMNLTNKMACISVGNALPAGYAGVAAPRTYDTTLGRWIEPYYPYPGLGAGAMWSRDTQGAVAGPPTSNVTIARNQITRTLPPRASAGEWNLGPLFTHYGFYTPPITDASFVDFGVVLYGPTVNVLISENIISGGLSRAAFHLDPNTDSTRSFERLVIERNLIEDVPLGVMAGRANDDDPYDGVVVPDAWGVTIRQNLFRLDPWWRFATRNASNGAWLSGSNSEGIAVSLSDVSGVELCDNIFEDCSRIVRTSPAALETWEVRGNVAKGYLVQIPFSTSNIGIGTGLDLPQECITYHDIVTDKTNPIYGTVTARPLPQSAVSPPAGPFYRRGHFVPFDGDPVAGARTLRGWIRRTSGRAAGAGNWTPDYGDVAA